MLTIPNVITLVRLLSAPFLIVLVEQRAFYPALLMFVASCFTDFLDGQIARRCGWESRVGAYLDPISDKALLSGLFAALWAGGIISTWLVALIFGRDLVILVGAVALMRLRGRRDFPPSIWGKISTFCQGVGGTIFLAAAAFPLPSLTRLSALAVWPVAAATAWSGIHYILRGIAIWQQRYPDPTDVVDAVPPKE